MAFRVLRIHEHQPAELPPFADNEVQDRLRRLWLRNHDLMLREEAVRELFHSSYVWAPDRAPTPERESSAPNPKAPAVAPADTDTPAPEGGAAAPSGGA